jgi:hypothetical protein
MDLSEAISEPFVQLIDFHNAFNRGVKVSFGAMNFLAERTKEDVSAGPAVLPTGSEPWGRETRWRDLDGPLKEASVFISEMGITRAAAAFENYLTNAKSEFDRAKLEPAREKKEGAPALQGFDAILGSNGEAMQNLVPMAEFFDASLELCQRTARAASPGASDDRGPGAMAQARRQVDVVASPGGRGSGGRMATPTRNPRLRRLLSVRSRARSDSG